MKLVALTGGIGSGKTTVAKIFELLGVPVYNADKSARYQMEHHPILKSLLIEHFGSQAYHVDGRLNSEYISGIVFNEPTQLTWLNQAVHPYVAIHIQEWLMHAKDLYGVLETALLKESMKLTNFYKIVHISSPESLRIKRVVIRDGQLQEDILKKLRFQQTEEELLELADFTILNDGSQSLILQIHNIHKSISNEILKKC
ncbi:MAG: dephospho-CoA kinase [Saprospiraceae bacterium]|nr:dephospho-CoA kinase [Saprospiraceae bacterium]